MAGRRINLCFRIFVLLVVLFASNPVVPLRLTAVHASAPEHSAAEVQGSKPVNLAAAENGGQVVSVTDELQDYPASNLIDAYKLDYGEWWTHGNPSFPQTVVVALGTTEPKVIDRVVLNPWTSEWRYSWAKDFSIYVSDSASDINLMHLVGSYTLEHVGADQTFSFDPTPAKYVGLVVTSNYGSDQAVGLNEFEVYEATSETIASESLAPSDPDDLVAAGNGGRIIACSSTDPNGKWPVEHLIDGRTDTAAGWSSAEELEREQYVVFGFKGDARRLVGRVALNPYSANYEEDWVKDFELRGSETESDIDQMMTLGKFRLTQTAENQEFSFPPVSLRYIALIPLSNYGGTAYALNEFAVYRATSGSGEPETGLKAAELPSDVTPSEGNFSAQPAPLSTTPEPTPITSSKVQIAGSTIDNIDANITYNDLLPVVYHLYGPFFDPLVKTELTNRNDRPVTVRLEAAVKGYTEADVKTVTVEPGGTLTVEQNPSLKPDVFGLLVENRNATLSIRVDYLKEGEPKVIYDETAPVTIWARGNFPWNVPGFHNGTVFLASMVTPNDPAIGDLLRTAADYMPEHVMNRGYHTEDDADHEVWERMKAIYEAVASYDVTYIWSGVDFVPQSEEDHGFTMQRLRWPREVLESRSGMCVELSLLFASAFEAIGLRPIIITIPGHVYTAVPISWDSHTYYVLEGTMIGRYSFEDAVHTGNEEFMEALDSLEQDQLDEYFWLDVQEEREEGLVPMPWR